MNMYEKKCKWCGESFISSNKSYLFCLYCRSKVRMGGRDYIRMLVRIRDRFTCQDCGKVRTLADVIKHNRLCDRLSGRIKLSDIHHPHDCGKNSRGYDKKENLDDMVTLCHKCHYNRPEHTIKKLSSV